MKKSVFHVIWVTALTLAVLSSILFPAPVVFAGSWPNYGLSDEKASVYIYPGAFDGLPTRVEWVSPGGSLVSYCNTSSCGPIYTQDVADNGALNWRAFHFYIAGNNRELGTYTAVVYTTKWINGNPVETEYARRDFYIASAEILSNGGLNTYAGTSKIPTGWVAKLFSTKDGKSTTVKKEGTASVKISGTPSITKTLSYSKTVTGAGGDALTFSFWIKGSSVPSTGTCRGQVMLYSGTTLKITKTISCPSGTYTFKQKTVSFSAPTSYTKVVVKFTYAKTGGAIWIDGVSLTK